MIQIPPAPVSGDSSVYAGCSPVHPDRHAGWRAAAAWTFLLACLVAGIAIVSAGTGSADGPTWPPLQPDNHTVEPSGSTATLTDTVHIRGLIPGQMYAVRAQAMSAAGGEFYPAGPAVVFQATAESEAVSAPYTVPEDAQGKVAVLESNPFGGSVSEPVRPVAESGWMVARDMAVALLIGVAGYAAISRLGRNRRDGAGPLTAQGEQP